MVILLWSALLFTSSIFSFVYVSKTAYPDTVLHSDAEQNMVQYLLDESYQLLDYIDVLESDSIGRIYDYINVLNGNQPNMEINPRHKDTIERYISKLRSYDDPNGTGSLSSDGGGSDSSSIHIGKYFSSDAMVNYLEYIMSGNYTQEDIDSFKQEVDTKLGMIQEGIEECQEAIDDNNKKINGDPTSDDAMERLGYNNRLAQYRNTSDPTFLSLQHIVEGLEEENARYNNLQATLEELTVLLNESLDFIEESFEKGMENTLQIKIKDLFKEINQDDIDVSEVLIISKDLYAELLDGNVSSSDVRIIQYAAFKEAVSNYGDYILVRQSIEGEIELLSNYSQAMLSEDNDHSTETEQVNNLSDPSDASSGQDSDTDPEAMVGEIKDGAWERFWAERLAALLSEIQDLPSEIDLSSLGDSVNTEKKLYTIDKAEILKNISDRKRLYLVELNDFDRGLTLLSETIFGFHDHGNMVIVSLLFAFGLDLFSLGMGILLYFFRPAKPKQCTDDE